MAAMSPCYINMRSSDRGVCCLPRFAHHLFVSLGILKSRPGKQKKVILLNLLKHGGKTWNSIS